MMPTNHQRTEHCILCGMPTPEFLIVPPSPEHPEFGNVAIRYPLCLGCDPDLKPVETVLAAMRAHVKSHPFLQAGIELSKRNPSLFARS